MIEKMPFIFTAVEEFLMNSLLSEKASLLRKNRADWALTALSVLLSGVGVFLLVLSLDRFLESLYPPATAALFSGMIVLAAAFLAAYAASYCQRRKVLSQAHTQEEISQKIRLLIESLCSELDAPIQENPKMAILLAALAGFFTARS